VGPIVPSSIVVITHHEISPPLSFIRFTSHITPSCMPYWSLLLLLLVPFVTFLRPGFIAMATLSTIHEESDGPVEVIDEDEVDLVPETQFTNDYHSLTFSDEKNDENDSTARPESVTPGTKRFLDAARPSPSHRPAFAVEFLSRPKSSGEESQKGFTFAKHVMPNMNFSHERQPQSPPPKMQAQHDPEGQGQDKTLDFSIASLLTSM
jgi:hypothetical protein